jgi:hypothetical protein
MCRMVTLYCSTSSTRRATPLNVMAHLRRDVRLLLSVRDIISWPKIYVLIYSKRKRWLVTPARMYSIIVLQESIHEKLSTVFVCPSVSSWNRTAAIAVEMASLLMMYGSSSSGWMRSIVCANLARSATKAFCISVDQCHFMPFRNSDRGAKFSM